MESGCQQTASVFKLAGQFGQIVAQRLQGSLLRFRQFLIEGTQIILLAWRGPLVEAKRESFTQTGRGTWGGDRPPLWLGKQAIIELDKLIIIDQLLQLTERPSGRCQFLSTVSRLAMGLA